MLTVVFYVLIGVFVVIFAEMFVPAVGELLQGPFLFLLPFGVFFLLGVALLVLTLRQGIEGKPKKFLLLTGGSAAAVFVCVLLHNFLYALAILTEHILVLHYLFEFLHAAFFVVGVLACPLGFVVGVIGSVVQLRKRLPS